MRATLHQAVNPSTEDIDAAEPHALHTQQTTDHAQMEVGLTRRDATGRKAILGSDCDIVWCCAELYQEPADPTNPPKHLVARDRRPEPLSRQSE
jgi:hypothetical protein